MTDSGEKNQCSCNRPQTAGERLWCLACGTVTGNMVCDCNGWPDGHEMKREPNFVNYADEMQKTAHEQAQEIERLRGELERARGLLTLTLHTEAHSQADSASIREAHEAFDRKLRNNVIEECAEVAEKYWAREVASQIRALTRPERTPTDNKEVGQL